VYFQGIDAGSHDFERYVFGRNLTKVRPPRVSQAEVEEAMARVSEMYVYNDALIGGLVAQTSEDTDVIVLSDHGWEYDSTAHQNNPSGVFVAAGPSFKARGKVEGLSVLDVLPVVLTILGVPLSRDFDGEIPKGLLRDDLVAKARWVDSYPFPPVALPDDVDSVAPEDALMIERLKSLGYVK
jgi:arylsulfatase A-like enzyme